MGGPEAGGCSHPATPALGLRTRARFAFPCARTVHSHPTCLPTCLPCALSRLDPLSLALMLAGPRWPPLRSCFREPDPSACPAALRPCTSLGQAGGRQRRRGVRAGPRRPHAAQQLRYLLPRVPGPAVPCGHHEVRAPACVCARVGGCVRGVMGAVPLPTRTPPCCTCSSFLKRRLSPCTACPIALHHPRAHGYTPSCPRATPSLPLAPAAPVAPRPQAPEVRAGRSARVQRAEQQGPGRAQELCQGPAQAQHAGPTVRRGHAPR